MIALDQNSFHYSNIINFPALICGKIFVGGVGFVVNNACVVLMS